MEKTISTIKVLRECKADTQVHMTAVFGAPRCLHLGLRNRSQEYGIRHLKKMVREKLEFRTSLVIRSYLPWALAKTEGVLRVDTHHCVVQLSLQWHTAR